MKPVNRQLTGSYPGDFLSTRFLQAREHARMSVKDAARVIGLTERKLQNLESGCGPMMSSPDPDVIAAAANAYGVSQVWLYAGAQGGVRFVPDWYRPSVAA